MTNESVDARQPVVEMDHVDKHFGELHVLAEINMTTSNGEVL